VIFLHFCVYEFHPRLLKKYTPKIAHMLNVDMKEHYERSDQISLVDIPISMN
jgi:hypothetical protein